MSEKTFQLTLGPVQGFVAQARRSRDYWAGSFILSWLSGVAILSVIQQKGKVSFPVPDEDFLDAMKGALKSGARFPKQGGIPNRFKTEGMDAQVEEGFKAQLVVKDIRDAWAAMAELVWSKDVLPFLQRVERAGDLNVNRESMRAIWDRQVDAIWDISWVLFQGEATDLLDRRKNWRTHYHPQELGSKCMMMGAWQELSGSVDPAKASSNSFWKAFREHIGPTDLNEGEQLCALGFIKRRFAHHFGDLRVTLDSGVALRGWSFKGDDSNTTTPLHVPALPYLAAVPWLENVLTLAQSNPEIKADLAALFEQSHEVFGGLPSLNTAFPKLGSFTDPIKKVDGMTFFPHMVTSEVQYRNDRVLQRAQKRELEHRFNRLLSNAKVSPPSPFYALLIMDGDSLGVQMGDKDKQEGISNALNKFTNAVQEIVQQHNGLLIYAGGDDVLAMLPQEYALPCSIAIREKYDQLFELEIAASTISAGIIYAHIKSPLMKMISAAHHLLDDIAKDKTGRDSLAVQVYKPGGLHCEWSMPCAILLQDRALLNVVNQLCDSVEPAITKGWLNKVHALLLRLIDEEGQLLIEASGFEKLVLQEYKKSASTQQAPDAVEKSVSDLLSACRIVRREAEIVADRKHPGRFTFDPTFFPQKNQTQMFQPDAIKLIRFLATKEV